MLWNNRDVVQVMGTELNGLANGSGALGTTIYDNTILTGKANRFADFWIQLPAPVSNFAADSPFELYGVPASPVDDTTYEETTAGASPVVNKNSLLAVFDLQVGNPQNRSVRGIPLQMYKWKFFVINTSGQQLAATLNKLWIATYTEA